MRILLLIFLFIFPYTASGHMNLKFESPVKQRLIVLTDITNEPDCHMEDSNQATIWRWREAYQYDFATRMDWNITSDYFEANHNPEIVLNGNAGKSITRANVKPGDQVTFSAAGSKDPDGDSLNFRWFIYSEAGSFTGITDLKNPDAKEISFLMPALDKGQALHLILEVKDTVSPALFS